METAELLKHFFCSDISPQVITGIVAGIYFSIKSMGVEGLDG